MSVRGSLPDFARAARAFSLLACGALLATAWAPAWAGPREKKPVKLTSTQKTEYKIIQQDKEAGRETVEKKTFDNNTVVFTIDATMQYGGGVVMTQHAELTLEEESYFPRMLHITKTIAQPNNETFEHKISVEMFANVAVVASELRGQKGERRLVVPTGVGIADLGVVTYLYQALFWYDRASGGNQRFQWLDPVGNKVQSGELKLDEDVTIPVIGKKTRVSVFKVEREKYGPATLWVDKQGTIVRGEMNFFTYELVKKTGS